MLAMSKRLVLENELVHLWYHPQERIVHHQFRKFIWGEQFRQVLNEGLRVFERESATKWLSDDRENSALSKDDTEWSMGDWFPRVAKAGWKHWAIVLPQNVIGQMNMARIIAAYSARGVSARVFDEPGAALDWLARAG
jgi:hypothetical protein